MKQKHTVTIIFVLLFATLFSACEDYGNPLDPSTMRAKPFQKMEPKKNTVPAGEPENQKSAQLEDYQRPTYPNGVRRNPFQPDPAFLIQQAEFETENARVKEPLEAFGIGQLRLAAIVSGITIPKAMFIDPSGLGHFAKVGDRIGEGGYVISAIRENSVTLSNDRPDEEGNSNVAAQTQILRLSDQLDSEEQQLSDEDREALARILNTSAGKKAVQQSMDSDAGSNSYDSNSNSTPGTEGGQ